MLHNILQTDSLYSLARHHGITKPCKTVYPLTDKLLTGRGLPSKSPAKGHWRHRPANFRKHLTPMSSEKDPSTPIILYSNTELICKNAETRSATLKASPIFLIRDIVIASHPRVKRTDRTRETDCTARVKRTAPHA